MSDALRTLLEDFAKLPAHVERPPTFMEIARYPHYENVCSNLLAFFLDPTGPHGLGILVLDALTLAGSITAADERFGGRVIVGREVTTDAGNRIDILIESESRVVLVENKIFAPVTNPFPDYAAHLDRVAGGRAKHKVLLTLAPTRQGREWGFDNLTHDRLIGQVRSALGHHISTADSRYVTLLVDFMNTLENLKRGTRMDKRFIDLLVDRENDVENFLSGLESLKEEMREKVKELAGRISVEKHSNVTQLKPWQDPMGRYDDLPHDIRVSEDLVVQVDTSIFPKGWEIWMWPSSGDYADLRDLLLRLEIPFEEHEHDEGVEHTDSYKHKYDESLDGIAALLQDLIDKIAAATPRP